MNFTLDLQQMRSTIIAFWIPVNCMGGAEHVYRELNG